MLLKKNHRIILFFLKLSLVIRVNNFHNNQNFFLDLMNVPKTMNINVVTTCLNCGRSILIYNNVFSEQIQVESEKNYPNKLKSQIISINYNCSNEVSHLHKVFDEISIYFTMNSMNYFPICPECLTLFKTQILSSITLIKNVYNDLFENFVKNPNFGRMMNDLIPIIKKKKLKTHPLSMTKASSLPILKNSERNNMLVIDDDDNQIDYNQHIPLSEDFCPDPISCIDESHKNLPILIDLEQKRQRNIMFCPLISVYAFRIGFDKLYGTINDMRIGFFKYNPNTLLENNAGLFFLCHLLFHFSNAFNVHDIFIRVFPKPSVTTVKDKFYDLVYPKWKRGVDNFNKSLESLFLALNSINVAISQLKEYSEPPFNVDTNLKTIGNVSYLLNWKKPQEWSTAMRFLLINLKAIQYRSIRSSFYH